MKLKKRKSNMSSLIDKPESYWFTPKYFSIRDQKFLRDQSFLISWAPPLNQKSDCLLNSIKLMKSQRKPLHVIQVKKLNLEKQRKFMIDVSNLSVTTDQLIVGFMPLFCRNNF